MTYIKFINGIKRAAATVGQALTCNALNTTPGVGWIAGDKHGDYVAVNLNSPYMCDHPDFYDHHERATEHFAAAMIRTGHVPFSAVDFHESASGEKFMCRNVGQICVWRS